MERGRGEGEEMGGEGRGRRTLVGTEDVIGSRSPRGLYKGAQPGPARCCGSRRFDSGRGPVSSLGKLL